MNNTFWNGSHMGFDRIMRKSFVFPIFFRCFCYCLVYYNAKYEQYRLQRLGLTSFYQFPQHLKYWLYRFFLYVHILIFLHKSMCSNQNFFDHFIQIVVLSFYATIKIFIIQKHIISIFPHILFWVNAKVIPFKNWKYLDCSITFISVMEWMSHFLGMSIAGIFFPSSTVR